MTLEGGMVESERCPERRAAMTIVDGWGYVECQLPTGHRGGHRFGPIILGGGQS